jgi:hypothetical protein
MPLLTVSDYDKLVFGQQSNKTRSLMSQRLTPMTQSPHYQFIHQVIRGDTMSGGGSYQRYLTLSWGQEKPLKKTVAEQVQYFRNLAKSIQTQKELTTPVLLLPHPDGHMIVVDGNHRCSVAMALQLPIPYQSVSVKDYIEKCLRLTIGAKYGLTNLPYQTIRFQGGVVMPGRRNDEERRLSLLDPSDFTGKRVLNLGSNIGITSFTVAQTFPSCHVVGYEYSPGLVSCALRLRNLYPQCNVDFQVVNLSQPGSVPPFDTVLCFSVDAHLKKKTDVLPWFKKSGAKTIYIEGHENRTLADYQWVVKGMLPLSFTLSQIGWTQNNAKENRLIRPLFKLRKNE